MAVEPPVVEVETAGGEPAEEDLPVVPLPEMRELNENEEKKLRRKEDALLRELRIFLRFVVGCVCTSDCARHFMSYMDAFSVSCIVNLFMVVINSAA